MKGSLQLLSSETSEDKDTEALCVCLREGCKQSSVARVEDFRNRVWLELRLTVSWLNCVRSDIPG